MFLRVYEVNEILNDQEDQYTHSKSNVGNDSSLSVTNGTASYLRSNSYTNTSKLSGASGTPGRSSLSAGVGGIIVI